MTTRDDSGVSVDTLVEMDLTETEVDDIATRIDRSVAIRLRHHLS